MPLFYTGKGDNGVSDLGSIKMDKTSIEIEAIGLVDEVNSLAGLIRAQGVVQEYREVIKNVQEDLFIIQANIGALMLERSGFEFKKDKIEHLERLIDQYEKEVQPEKGFVISGESMAASWLDYARAVARRAEVAVLKLQKERVKKAAQVLSHEIPAYLNRLSSLFFALARVVAKKEEKKEDHPKYK